MENEENNNGVTGKKKKCLNCRSKIDPDLDFCPVCGKKQPHLNKRDIIIAIAIAFILAIIKGFFKAMR